MKVDSNPGVGAFAHAPGCVPVPVPYHEQKGKRSRELPQEPLVIPRTVLNEALLARTMSIKQLPARPM